MTEDRPTVRRAEPDWPASPTEQAARVLGVLGVLLLAGVVVALVSWRRVRRRGGTPTPGHRAALFGGGLATAGFLTVSGPFAFLNLTPHGDIGVAFYAAMGVMALGLLLLFHRFWRWFGLGLLVGPVLTVLVGVAVLGGGIGS